MKSVITVQCPECNGYLEIDVARQRVLSHKLTFEGTEAEEKDKAELFDDVVARVKDRENKGDDLFDAARKSVKDSENRLDSLFGEMKEKIDEEKNREPGPDEVDPRDLFWD